MQATPQVAAGNMSVCHDAASLFQLQWPLSALAPAPGVPAVISPLSTLLATAYVQIPQINISASVRVVPYFAV